jgi:AraC-like DNA-binding protein
MRALFNYSGADVSAAAATYKSIIQSEFYDGDLETGDQTHVELSLEKELDYPISIVRLKSRNRISYRRSWHHIRANPIEVFVVWLTQRGGLKVSRSGEECVTGEGGGCAVFDSATPFYAELVTDEDGMHESVQAIIPAHLFRIYVGHVGACNVSLSVELVATTVVARLIELLAEHGHALERPLAVSTVETLLRALGESITHSARAHPRRSIRDKRYDDIETFIMRNLTNRALTVSMVASRCGISPRYLCYLLKMRGQSFAGLVWQARFEKAKEWLASPALSTYLIHEIALMAGYKSPAHFSRVFRATCNCTPSEYRDQHLPPPEGPDARTTQLPDVQAGARC